MERNLRNFCSIIEISNRSGCYCLAQFRKIGECVCSWLRTRCNTYCRASYMLSEAFIHQGGVVEGCAELLRGNFDVKSPSL
ncbi:hypothetical protein LINGRAHAP2_LOCUS35195 [Linum grandiflorum]